MVTLAERVKEKLEEKVEAPSLEGRLHVLGEAINLRKHGRPEDALAVLKGALGLGTDKPVLLAIGATLHQLERYAEALKALDEVAERWPEDPDVWVYRTAPLVQLEHMEEVLESLEKAYPLRHRASDRGALLFFCAAMATCVLGVTGVKNRWLPALETGTRAYIKWRERARRDKQLAVFQEAVQEMESSSLADREAVEEFRLSVRLLSIRDPFKGWKALTREIGKVWPKDVSAVDAIREQRRW